MSFSARLEKTLMSRLAKLGGKPIVDRLDCDVDYEAEAEAWLNKLIESLKGDFSAAPQTAVAAQTGAAVQGVAAQTYTKKAPFKATLIDAQKITGRDSVKDIRHIEISLEDSGITYQPGDALGVWFKNSASLVSELIGILSLDGNAEVSVGDAKCRLLRR
jgi:Sulfite reductase, alpha subunit (flavoprotein)